MKMKIFLGLIAIIFLGSSELGECHSDDDYDDDLTQRQIQIFKNFNAISKLGFGDKCNSDLESKGDKIREEFKPYLRSVFSSAIQHGQDGNEADEFQLTSSQRYARDSVIEGIEKFTNEVKRSKFGLNGICKETKSLYCDPMVGECRCGKREKPKGFSYVHVKGSCKFDFGSGCIQSEFSELTMTECRKGSLCVTGIENLKCTLENSIAEGTRNPSRFMQIKNRFGYTCYCERIGQRNSNIQNFPETYSRDRFTYSESESLNYNGLRAISSTLVLFFWRKFV